VVIKILYATQPHSLNRLGNAKATLLGGNLTILAHLTGSNSEIDFTNKILFIEDVGEYFYNIDRMMLQLKRAGKLHSLAGLIVGSFSEMKDTSIPFGKEVYEIIFDSVKEYDYPVCFNFPVGHTMQNYALKTGCVYDLQVNSSSVKLIEI